jgi:hypothetical protein
MGFMIRVLFFILLFLSTKAFAGVEICGDGRDNDASGTAGACPVGEVDAMCGGGCDKLCDTSKIDADGDAYGVDGLAPWGAGLTAGKDCDDTDRQIYPGADTIKGCPTGQFRTCLSTGAYSACSALSTYCPSYCSSCKYFNKTTGSNTNPGTYASPWRDYRMFTSYYSGGDEPAGYFAPTSGVCFVETGGATYNETYTYNTDTVGLTLRNRNCGSGSKCRIIGLPGTRFKIDLPGTVSTPLAAIKLWASDNWVIKNFELINNYSSVGVFDTDDSITGTGIENFCILNNSTIRGTNGAGIHLYPVATGTKIYNGVLGDNYDPVLPTGNQNIITFRDESTLSVALTSFYSVLGRGDGYKIKHANPTSSSTILGSVFQGVNRGITTGAGNHTFRYNLVEDADYMYSSEDLGGPTYQVGTKIFSDNTGANTGYFYLNPTRGWNLAGTSAVDACSGDTVVSPWTFERNVIVDNLSTYNQDNRFVRINTYGPDALYTHVFPSKLSLANSCEYNPNTPVTYGVHESNNGVLTCSGRGNLGTDYTFTTWQAVPLDTGSFSTNPSLDADFRATGTGCTNFGWRQLSQINGVVPTPTPTPSVTPTPVPTGNYKRRVHHKCCS